MISSSWCRKRERSFFLKGGGPPDRLPASRSWARRSRVARASPMFVSVKGRPVGPKHKGPRVQAAGGQGDISGDDDIIRFQVIDYVIIRRVKLID